MAKTDKEMREELARIRAEEIQKKIDAENALTASSRADARAAAADQLTKDGMDINPLTGRQSTYNEIASQLSSKALKDDVNAYNDWRSAMMSLWNIYVARGKSIGHLIQETITVPLSNAVMDYAILPLHDYISNKLTGDPELDLPVLQHEVTFTHDNKLSIAPLTRSDNHNETGALDALFDKGVRIWLHKQGYTESPDDKLKFVDSHGDVLKKADFDLLKNDPDNGLGNFLSGYSELDFRPRGP